MGTMNTFPSSSLKLKHSRWIKYHENHFLHLPISRNDRTHAQIHVEVMHFKRKMRGVSLEIDNQLTGIGQTKDYLHEWYNDLMIVINHLPFSYPIYHDRLRPLLCNPEIFAYAPTTAVPASSFSSSSVQNNGVAKVFGRTCRKVKPDRL